MRDDSILFTREILERVADEFDYSYETIEIIYQSYLASLKKIANFTDAVTIRLPYIGKLYMNKFYVDSELKVMATEGKQDTKRYKAFLEKQRIFELELQEHRRGQKILHLKKGRLKVDNFSKGKTLQQIEEIQNNRAHGTENRTD